MRVTFLTLLVLGGVALYVMTPEERAQLLRALLNAVVQAIRTAMQPSPGDPFNTFLLARTRWAIVTPLLVALNVLVFMLMLVGPGPLSDPQTLIAWGGNFAPRTTNGEWWRLVSATFVHAGMLHLLATTAALLPLGVVVERAVGPIAFTAVYLAAGILANVISLWTTSSMHVGVGASGALFGMYGLALASAGWALLSRPATPIPPTTLKWIGAGAAIFFLYNLNTAMLGTMSELAALTTGVVAGLLMARGIAHDKPAMRRAVPVMAVAVLIAFVGMVPVRGVADVRPEIARVIAAEEKTAEAYDKAVAKFRRGWISNEALVEVIDRTIEPELQAVRTRLNAVRGVPPEHMPLVHAAEQYFELREQSWRRRAEGLLESDMEMLREADRTERAALDAFQRMKPAG